MPLTPGYGETPLPHDELTALLPHVVKVLEKPVSRAAVYGQLADLIAGLLLAAADVSAALAPVSR
jgi:hypothetical protein